LSTWLSNQRSKYNGKARYGYISDEQVKKLENLGVRLANTDTWQSGYEKAKTYHKQHGHIDIPNSCQVEGYDLGYWLYCQRKAYKESKLTKQQIKLLDTLNMIWLSPAERRWQQYLQELKKYKQQHGSLCVPVTYRTGNGFGLGRWLDDQRKKEQLGKLPIAQVEQLRSLGVERGSDKQTAKRERVERSESGVARV
jgi:hypothetical protein